MKSTKWLHTKNIEAETKDEFKSKLLKTEQDLRTILEELNLKYESGWGLEFPHTEIMRFSSTDCDLTLTKTDYITPFNKSIGYGNISHMFMAHGEYKAVDEVASKIKNYYKLHDYNTIDF